MQVWQFDAKSVTAWASAALIAIAGAGPLHAQAPYPSKPVRVIVPFPPGTSVDTMARRWGEQFANGTGQPVVIDNRPGAGTIIGAQLAANAQPDGYTLLWTVNNTFSINPFVYRTLPYKAQDFVPVTRILSVPFVLVVSAQSPIRTIQDLIREAKARPGSMTYASAGIGTGTHVALAKLLGDAGVSMIHVPYKDYYISDVIARRVDIALDASGTAVEHIKGGKVRGLAVTSSKRFEVLPDVPAAAEVFPGYVGDSWMGIFAPKATPDDVVETIVVRSKRIVESAGFRAALRNYALTPAEVSSEAFRKFLVEDARAWEQVVKANAIALE